jgi:ABC-2 type transport system ATP-binding protein
MSGGVVAEGLVKRFGTFTALDGVDFTVPEGTVVGLLGPNGAGKTTTIRILTTLLSLDGGRATVAGHAVVTEPQLVRAVIGLTGQYAAVDEDLTGRENLVLIGRLSRMARLAALARAGELLEIFDLSLAGDRLLRTYSGGMRRRLDLAASLMVAPPVLFLDEPTTGLDPRSRLGLWDVIKGLKDQGTTISLTTQYLEEADQLADSISVIDGGKIIAEGTADQLKAKVGGDVLELRLVDRGLIEQAIGTLTRTFKLSRREVTVDPELGTVTVPVTTGAAALASAVRALDRAKLPVADLGLRRPSLDDVFLSLTGHTAESARPEAPEPRRMSGALRG